MFKRIEELHQEREVDYKNDTSPDFEVTKKSMLR